MKNLKLGYKLFATHSVHSSEAEKIMEKADLKKQGQIDYSDWLATCNVH